MKAVAVSPSDRLVEVVEIEAPRLERAEDVRIRMLEVGVCGTDKEICSFAYGTPPDGERRLVIGHEGLGEVIEAGEKSGLGVGDLVIPTVRRPCGVAKCAACRAERQDFCFTGEFTERGIKGRHGYMTEEVVDEGRFMVRVPRALRDVAVLVEPLTIAEKALLQVWQVQQRLPWACDLEDGKTGGHCHTAVILGAGPVGLLGAMAFAAGGFRTVVYSREEARSHKADLVRSIGAGYVSAVTHDVESMARTVGAIDVVYEATGASKLSFEVLSRLGPNALFVFTGVPGRKAPIEVDTDLIMRNLVLKNQVVMGTVNAGRDAFEAAVRDLGVFMKKWPEAVHALITGRKPIDRAREFLLSPEGIKNVVAFG